MMYSVGLKNVLPQQVIRVNVRTSLGQGQGQAPIVSYCFSFPVTALVLVPCSVNKNAFQ